MRNSLGNKRLGVIIFNSGIVTPNSSTVVLFKWGNLIVLWLCALRMGSGASIKAFLKKMQLGSLKGFMVNLLCPWEISLPTSSLALRMKSLRSFEGCFLMKRLKKLFFTWLL